MSLHRKITLISILCIGIGVNTKAQGNLQYVDDKLFHFGFSLGFNEMDFIATPSLESIDGKVYSAWVSSLQPGFSVGVIGDMRINRYLNLRCTPTLHFGSHQIKYTADSSKTTFTTSITSIPFTIPMYIKYSAERKDNYRPYLIGGGGVSFNMSADQTKPILLRRFNTFVEFGVGCDIYFSFFKLAPELKFGLGFNNLLTALDQRKAGDIQPEDKKFTQALSGLTTRMLTLTFNFE